MARNRRSNGRAGRKQESGPAPVKSDSDSGKELLDEEVLGSGVFRRVHRSSFKEVGLACPDCEFRTIKRGLSGVQAMRAHSKCHVRDRRARRRQALRLLALLALSLVMSILPIWFEVPFRLESRSKSGVVEVLFDWLGLLLALVSIALAGSVLLAWSKYLSTGMRIWSSRYSYAVTLSLLPLLIASVSRWTEPGGSIHWPWLLATQVPWSASFITGPGVAKTRLSVRRRQFVPRSRLRLFRSTDGLTDTDIKGKIRELRASIQDGQIRIDRLAKKHIRILRRIGLGDVTADPVKVEARLAAEERRLDREMRRRSSDEDRRRREMARRQTLQAGQDGLPPPSR